MRSDYRGYQCQHCLHFSGKYCMRFPPVPVQQSRRSVLDSRLQTYLKQIRPPVSKDTPACGEFTHENENLSHG